MADLFNAFIEITEEGKTSKGQYGLIKKIKGKDIETGQTNTYTIYETKQDGSISEAWKTYNNGALLGQTVAVGFATKEGTLQDGTPFTQRIIRSIDLDIGNGMKNARTLNTTNTPSQSHSPVSGANRGATAQSEGFKSFPFKSQDPNESQKQFGRRLAIQGHINALLSNPSMVMPTSDLQFDWSRIVKLAIQIEDEAEKQINPSVTTGYDKWKQSAPKEDLPTIQVEEETLPFSDDEVNVEGIPF